MIDFANVNKNGEDENDWSTRSRLLATLALFDDHV